MRHALFIALFLLVALLCASGTGCGCDALNPDVPDYNPPTADDDDDDDDFDDDDADDDDDDDDDDDSEPGVQVERIAGGAPGYGGVWGASAPDGTPLFAAVSGREVILYTVDEGEAEPEIVTSYGRYPEPFFDAAGNLYVAFLDTETDQLAFASRVGGRWTVERADLPDRLVHPPVFAKTVGPAGDFHVAWIPASGPSYDLYLSYATNASGEWADESVGDERYVGGYPDLAIDADGVAHLSYHDPTQNTLRTATNASGAWDRTEVAPGGRYTSIALDADGAAHVVHARIAPAGLAYATDSGGAWQTAAVEVEGADEYPTALTVDGGGVAHVAFRSSGSVMYASGDIGGFAVETVAASDGETAIALTLDDSGAENVAYYDDQAAGIDLAVRGESDWTVGTLATGSIARSASSAVDGTGTLHVAYVDETSGGLDYATDLGGQWRAARVADSDGSVLYAAIAVDSSGVPHVAFCDRHGADPDASVLRYASQTDGGWEVETVDDESTGAGRFVTLVIDADDAPHVGSYSAGAGELVYTTREADAWTADVAVAGGDLAGEHDLAVGANGAAHIAYLASGDAGQELRYTTNGSGSWTDEVADDEPDSGSGASIALDSAGFVHVVYQRVTDSTGGRLRHATNVTGKWLSTVLDATGDTGYGPSLVIDADDDLHVLYSVYDDEAFYRTDLTYGTDRLGPWTHAVVDTAGEVGEDASLSLSVDGTAHAVYLGETALYHAWFPADWNGDDK